jgi:hypothetical protein
MGEYIVYQSETVAFVQSDELASKLSRAVLLTSGTKIIRGWEEVEAMISKGKQVAKKAKSESALNEKDTKGEELSRTTSEISSPTTKPVPRDIRHLILVIHGYPGLM